MEPRTANAATRRKAERKGKGRATGVEKPSLYDEVMTCPP